METLRSFDPSADASVALGWGIALALLAVVFIIGMLVMTGSLKGSLKDHRAARWRELKQSRGEAGMVWPRVGAGLTILALTGFVVWTLSAMVVVAMPAPPADITVKVTGSQWWWAVNFVDRQQSKSFTTANEIHIPVGASVRLELASGDVVHSFWVPQLARKTDAIPGQTQVMWLQADKAADYSAECGQYCGEQHAHMSMSIVADEPEDYAVWLRRQFEPARLPTSDAAREGQRVFAAHCAACHAVRGTAAAGRLGPDLTHLMSRKTLAAGVLPNTPGKLSAWIANAQSLKPGSQMPSIALSAADLQAVVVYLEGLQ